MVLLQTRMPSLSNSPRMRSAPHRRFSLAISLIKSTVSWEILGAREAALDLYLQKSLKPWRCHREIRLWLNDEQCLFPGVYHACQQDQEHAVRLGTGRSFHLSTQDDHLLAQQCIFCDQFGLPSGKVGQRPQQEGGGVWLGPSEVAVMERPKTQAYQLHDEDENSLHSIHPLCEVEQVN